MNSSEDFLFSKVGQRKVSPFIGQELLYDYMTEQLDPERKKAVEEHIKENRDVQNEIKKIRNGIDYVLQLSETQVSEALLEKAKQPTTYLQIILQKIRFDDWPPVARMGLEACLVAFGITAFAVIIPWNNLINIKWGSPQVVLSEIDKQLAKKPQAETEVGAKEQISFPDEGSGRETAKTTATTLKVVDNSTPPEKPKEEIPVKQTSPPEKSKEIAAKAATAVAPAKEAKVAGFLYRGAIKMTNPKAVAPKIVEKISALGARKAGNVELGWSKGTGAYYHFTMPESKYEEMLEIFKAYGQLKIQKEKHERLMPDGIIRLIIEAEEKR